jgi:general secretion pathway protein G
MPSRRVRSSRGLPRSAGYTLIEIAITLTIVGILAAVGGSQYGAYLDRARTARAIAELHAIADTIDPGGDEDATYPATLADAGISALDPWGNPYQYLLIQGNLPRGLAARSRDLPPVAAAPSGAGQDPSAASGSGAGATSGSASGSGSSGSTATGSSGASSGTGSSTGASGAGSAGSGSGAASGGGPGGGGGPAIAMARKDRFQVPINSDFDLYSMGPDGQSMPTLNAPVSRDDILRANDGAFYGIAEEF